MPDAASHASRKTAEDVISEILERTQSDAAFLPAVAAMRANQHHHEKSWIAARNIIVTKYDTKRTLNTLLMGAGGSASLSESEIAAMQAAELRTFDEKLRLVMGSMAETQQSELRSLGVTVLRNDDAAMARVYAVLEELIVKSQNLQQPDK